MRIVTWNIELGRNIDRAAAELRDSPNLAGADVILVQEMSPQSTEQLASLLNMSYVYDAAAEHPTTGQPFGNAILSSWPIGEPTALALPHTAVVDGQPRSAIFSTVTIDSGPVTFGSIHIETVLLDLRHRVQQLRPVADYVQAIEGPCVLGGDFNSASRRSRRSFESVLAEAGLHRSSQTNQATFHRFGRPFTLDHIFTRGLRRLDAGVVGSTSASDHYPVWVELEALAG